VPTATLVVEILSAGDGTWDKLAFYAGHDVGELLILDPPRHTVPWLALQPDRAYRPIQHSELLALGPHRVDWA
jgi:hypothetical protein